MKPNPFGKLRLLLLPCFLLSTTPMCFAAEDIRTEQVEFKTGANSAVVQASIKGYETVDYELGAKAGENLTTATDIVQKAKSECASFEDGKFNTTEQTITLHDFTGDGRPEELVDASQFSCSTSVSMWGGSGGTFLWVLVDGKIHEFLAHKWRVVDVDGQKVLLLAVHSSECSDILGPCYRALVWSDGFRTIR